MQIGILNEPHDARVSITPDIVKLLEKEGNEVIIESQAGVESFISDEEYKTAGGRIEKREIILKESDLLICIRPLVDNELGQLKKGAILVSNFEPFAKPAVLDQLAKYAISAISLDMIPRITIAQSMDILSSMASIAGYKAVIMAANYIPRYFPMLTTAAGSIPPSKVLVIGAGVAGLQAIATAKRLGAVVEAFDTRAAAKEEVMSLGAKFVEVEGAVDDRGAGGYAVEQTEEYKKKQREKVREKVVAADVVITTAQLRGRPAPTIVTKDMVNEMKAGSVIVDIASSTGGNCELSQDNKIVQEYGVTIIGNSELAADVPQHASKLYAKNIHNFLKVFVKEGALALDLENEILKSAVIVHDGAILYKS